MNDVMLTKIFRKADKILFRGAIRSGLRRHREAKKLALIESGLQYRFISFYEKNYRCEISSLCDKYGSDKGELRKDGHPYPWASHTYADFYHRLFWHCRSSVRKVFECGLGTNNPNLLSSMGISGKPGASLRVWRDFFPNAMVYGADIDRDVLFEENRIKTFFIDQLDQNAIKSFWYEIDVEDFDFMVDDGLHTFEAGSSLFLNSIARLGINGIYVIEDVSQKDLLRYKDFFRNKEYVVEYVCLFRPSIGLGDNNLVVVRKNNSL